MLSANNCLRFIDVIIEVRTDCNLRGWILGIGRLGGNADHLSHPIKEQTFQRPPQSGETLQSCQRVANRKNTISSHVYKVASCLNFGDSAG